LRFEKGNPDGVGVKEGGGTQVVIGGICVQADGGR